MNARTHKDTHFFFFFFDHWIYPVPPDPGVLWLPEGQSLQYDLAAGDSTEAWSGLESCQVLGLLLAE